MGFKNPVDLPAELREKQAIPDISPSVEEGNAVVYITKDDATEEIRFRGEDWRIFWPKHARNRTYDRHSNPRVAKHCLNFLLSVLDPISDRFWPDFTGEVTLRAFPLKSCFILKVDKIARNMCVTTYGDCVSFTPRYGDTVVTLAENGNATCCKWQKNSRDPAQRQDKKFLGRCAYLS